MVHKKSVTYGKFRGLLNLLLVETIVKTLLVLIIGTFLVFAVLTLLLSAYGLKAIQLNDYFSVVTALFSSDQFFSDYFPATRVIDIILTSFCNTALLSAIALMFAIPAGILLSNLAVKIEIHSNLKKRRCGKRKKEKSVSLLVTLLCSIPTFSLCYLSYDFGVSFFPYLAGGIIIGFGSGIVYDLFLHNKRILSKEMEKEYLLNLYTSGVRVGGALPAGNTILSFAFSNGLKSVIPFIVQRIPILVGETIVIEIIFRIPGLGKAFLLALAKADVPVIIAITLLYLVIIRILTILSLLVKMAVNPYGQE